MNSIHDMIYLLKITFILDYILGFYRAVHCPGPWSVTSTYFQMTASVLFVYCIDLKLGFVTLTLIYATVLMASRLSRNSCTPCPYYTILAVHYVSYIRVLIILQWRHDECDGVSNHKRLDCLLNGLFRRRSQKTSKLRVTGLSEGNSPVTGEFPAQRASHAENVSIWWRHHASDEKVAIITALAFQWKFWRFLGCAPGQSLLQTMMTSSNANIFRVPLCGDSPHKGQWRGALMFSLVCTWINGWVNNRETGDLDHHCAHYDVIVMQWNGWWNWKR